MPLTAQEEPASSGNHYILELNANPGFAIHAAHYRGTPRPVADALLIFSAFENLPAYSAFF